MSKNIGNTDRLIRLIVGILIIIIAGYNQSWWALLGVALVITALVRFCGLYKLVGINTCKVESKTAPVQSENTNPKAPDVADKM